MKKLSRIFCAALCALILAACGRQDPEAPSIRRVFLMYSAAFNNLSPSIAHNEQQLLEGDLPFAGSDDVLLLYSHHTSKNGVYTVPTNPVLVRAYTAPNGLVKKDTLIIYPDTDVSSSPEVLRQVLLDVKDLFPASQYGLLISSHAKGWLPIGYQESSLNIFSAPDDRARRQFPLTKELCIENVDGGGMEMAPLADAIPYHLDFFIMDACLMGCVEVAYELRDKCDKIIFSPTEILSYGMIYSTMAKRLFGSAEADLKGICVDYMDYYKGQTGVYQSATITLVDCRKLEPLASACAALVGKYRTSIESIKRSQIQAYFYNDLHWFYDLRDIFEQAGAGQVELSAIDAALQDCILFKDATPTFFGITMDRVCGLSCYVPGAGKEELEKFYKTLAWNKAIGLIQ